MARSASKGIFPRSGIADGHIITHPNGKRYQWNSSKGVWKLKSTMIDDSNFIGPQGIPGPTGPAGSNATALGYTAPAYDEGHILYSVAAATSNGGYNTSNAWQTIRTFALDKSGSVRISYEAYITSGQRYWAAKVMSGSTQLSSGGYATNLAPGVTDSVHNYRKFSYVVNNINAGDLIEIQVAATTGNNTNNVTSSSSQPIYMKNFEIRATAPSGVYSGISAAGVEENPFIDVAHAVSSSAPEGLHWFVNSSGQKQELYFDPNDGGWILVASNYWTDGYFPGGTNRKQTQFFLNRNGTLGQAGTCSPNRDYLIGAWIDGFSFNRCRVYGFGRGSTNGSKTWSNKGTSVIAQWNTTSKDTVTPRSSVSVVGDLHGSAGWFSIDGIYSDYRTGGFNANSNQVTIGGVGTGNSNGDPNNGTYLGHGASEGDGEGWYYSGGNADADGYTTWLR